MALKIDLQKAYDRLSWKFLKSILTAFGFHPRWIKWVMSCVSIASTTLILNGVPFSLHHLFFADDVFLMGKCSVDEGFYFKECLDTFCSWVNSQVAGLIMALMRFERITPNITYLGFPLFRSGHNKDFTFLIEQWEAKLIGWKSRVLSKAKRLVLIKSVTISLSSYAMQPMCLPSSICSKLDAIVRNFWWAASGSNKPLCLKAWGYIC
ncbi:hypothetical protein UlMin_035205 [Ulmus minor]